MLYIKFYQDFMQWVLTLKNLRVDLYLIEILNLCFTLISGSDYDVEEQKSKNNDFIISTLNKFSIVAHASGRNDILVNERKISGAAFQIQQGNLMHHGTLLVNSDLNKLQLYLKPSKDKIETKGIK